ncbi:hypothetical protein [Azospirillum thermophilum]|uniref:hypothetical protein n=1 Tax=Azospirillum thermophilum TaxID=2202148 RepID=UPI0011B60847|nr:hypothetical protein [Azospirillum thermophilum]
MITNINGTRPKVTFVEQDAPIEEYGRALYAVARSVLRAHLDALSNEDLTDLNTPLVDVRMRQLAKVCRLDRDLGMRGDGFEWAVHEAVLGKEPRVMEPLSAAMHRASQFLKDVEPNSLMFGQERARYLGFTEAIVDEAGTDAYLLPEGSGRPFKFGPWVATAAAGKAAEPHLPERIKAIWKTDLFLSGEGNPRYLAATVKSNFAQLEGGRGLRIGIVPESPINNQSGVRYSNNHKLWVVSLADPNGFMGLFNDAYMAVGRALCTLGKQSQPPYYTKPSAKAQKVQIQLERYPDATVLEIEDALDEAAQQKLVSVKNQLVRVNAPDWLHIKAMAPRIITAKPKFDRID